MLKIQVRTFFKSSIILIFLVTSNANANTAIKIQILSATIKDQQIPEASVILQRNGAATITGTTDALGQVNLDSSFVDDGESLLIVKKTGFSNLIVKCPCSGTTYALSPIMTNLDGMRIVLNWNEAPMDLDSHLVYPGNHVFYSNPKGKDSTLDVDDTASYGPETITLALRHGGERYVYAVYNYSDRGDVNSKSLSSSGAKIFIYIGQTLIRTYYVPKNAAGNLWTVFAVTEQGEIQDFNLLTGIVAKDRLQQPAFQDVTNNSSINSGRFSTRILKNEKDLNDQGEAEYHAGNFDSAIHLYKKAIELNAFYGQAYSNLGLAFQKAGRVSEALWANRKAIALAHGPTVATVRASSHFNNAKIYEEASRWSDALREFQAANAEKSNPSYDKGIKRMREKGAM
jgi:uncharacterized protein YfaP (DUF2135 family)